MPSTNLFSSLSPFGLYRMVFFFHLPCYDRQFILLIVSCVCLDLFVFCSSLFCAVNSFLSYSFFSLGILVSRSQYQLTIHIDYFECLRRILSRFNKSLCLINDVALLLHLDGWPYSYRMVRRMRRFVVIPATEIQVNNFENKVISKCAYVFMMLCFYRCLSVNFIEFLRVFIVYRLLKFKSEVLGAILLMPFNISTFWSL